MPRVPHRASLIRGVIARVNAGKVQRIDGTGRVGETFVGRELFQHYGFASRPLKGCENIWAFLGGDVNNAVSIAEDDRRYRPATVDGESVHYSDEGDFIWLKRGNLLHIYSKANVKVESDGDIAATAKGKITGNAPGIDATATTKADITAPAINLNGVVNINGSLNVAAADGVSATTCNLKGSLAATGDITDKKCSMDADRIIYNEHTHNDPQGSVTGVPNQPE